jgi:hypothetical protein
MYDTHLVRWAVAAGIAAAALHLCTTVARAMTAKPTDR